MRYEDWQSRYWEALEKLRAEPFEYGKRDCVLFAASMADAITVDGSYVERTREAFPYDTIGEAMRLIARRPLPELVESVLGPRVPWQRLQMGDIVIARYTLSFEGFIVGTHDGDSMIAPTDRDLRAIPWTSVIGGWSVT